jgi:hypothetical protein
MILGHTAEGVRRNLRSLGGYRDHGTLSVAPNIIVRENSHIWAWKSWWCQKDPLGRSTVSRSKNRDSIPPAVPESQLSRPPLFPIHDA